MVQARHVRTLLKSLIFLPIILVSVAAAICGETPSTSIKVDQVGYLLSGRKIVMVSAPAATFVVKRASDNATIFKGKLSPAAPDTNSGDTLQAADFSSLRETGKYYLEVPGIGRSWTFPPGKTCFRARFISPRAHFTASAAGRPLILVPSFRAIPMPRATSTEISIRPQAKRVRVQMSEGGMTPATTVVTW